MYGNVRNVWDVFRVLLGRAFMFGLRTQKPKNFLLKPSFFSSPEVDSA